MEGATEQHLEEANVILESQNVEEHVQHRNYICQPENLDRHVRKHMLHIIQVALCHPKLDISVNTPKHCTAEQYVPSLALCDLLWIYE
jgi:hypothetical protein